MAQGKLALKARIRSVDSTKKITKAMQLVASSKLKKQKENMEKNKEYAHNLKEIVTDILNQVDEPHIYIQEQPGIEVIVVFTSDMGLCGGYNANMFRMLEKEVAKTDEIVMIGSRGVNWIARRDFHLIDSRTDLMDDCYNDLAKIGNTLLDRYQKGEISKIKIMYTSFVNSVTFHPILDTILPIQKEEKTKQSNIVTEFEPSGTQILDELIPMYMNSLLYSYFLESKTSEQANRRMAMESATDNAEEIKETLELQYNQARQAAITQEITEIVGGVSAIE